MGAGQRLRPAAWSLATAAALAQGTHVMLAAPRLQQASAPLAAPAAAPGATMSAGHDWGHSFSAWPFAALLGAMYVSWCSAAAFVAHLSKLQLVQRASLARVKAAIGLLQDAQPQLPHVVLQQAQAA